MRPSLYIALCLLSAPSSEATLISRTASRIHHAATKRSARLAKDIRSAFSNVLIDQPIVGPDTGNRVYCVANPADAQNNTATIPADSGNPVIVSSIVSGSSLRRPTATSTSGGSPSPTPTSPWTLVETREGASFFDGWDFWSLADPTNGDVTFLDMQDAQSNGLIGVNSAGNVIMKVETTAKVSGNRKSIRIQSKNNYTGGLVIMDAVHMPAGCGTWPAFWSNGPNWPAGGEIDIIEGVNDYTNNQATLHTNPGCGLASSDSKTLSISGTLVSGTDCSVTSTSNQGCGVRSNSNSTYGAGFNSIGGGVYAMQWDTSGIAVFFFPRSSIPADIQAQAPQPSTWGLAMARWPAIDCDPFKFFYQHVAIFDTTLCGDWAGGVWSSSGLPGQAQSCAALTGYATCQDFVQNNGSAFQEAYWEVVSYKRYQSNST
ncbi:glycoside hydrolase family 16 protein [Thelephora terrestris]|uniref:Glycoside hydrolase family 16 protein n=1 Tax=Thelephora terrestris TaxID=56493 RepID=A0A9P6HH84_9AGAM|nr:glycoside hydrolase family 16 protein [Thelephora terrestris]